MKERESKKMCERKRERQWLRGCEIVCVCACMCVQGRVRVGQERPLPLSECEKTFF